MHGQAGSWTSGGSRILMVLFASFVLALPNCKKQDDTRSNRRNAQINQAYRHLDDKNSQKAIEILEMLLQEEEDNEVRIALASAYVQKADLPTDRFYAFARTWIETTEADEFTFLNRSPQLSSESDATDVLREFGLPAMSFLLKARHHFEQLPELKVEAEPDLKKAISILGELKAPTSGQALYRGMIQFVLLKHELKGGHFLKAEATALLCEMQANAFIAKVEKLLSQVEFILNDLAVAFPKNAKDWQLADQSLRDAKKALAGFSQKISPETKWDLLKLVKLAERQWGWKWSCQP